VAAERVAILHDWLVTWGGAERVLEQMLACYPGADVFCVVEDLDAERRSVLDGRRLHTSFIQRLPRAKRAYWHYAGLMPLAIEQFDLRGYDLVLSSSHAVALGAITGPDQLHVSFLHSPMRFVWDLQPLYLESFGFATGPKSLAARLLFHYLRNWDRGAANGVDRMLTCSAFAARRIAKVHRRAAAVVHPPVDVERFALSKSREREHEREPYFLTGSRMNPFKRIDVVVEAFRALPDQRLLVLGDGPDLPKVRALAGPNVELLGHVSDDEVRRRMQGASAFVHAATEDFGIAMGEAQACGTPVVALGAGGACEIVRDAAHDPAPTGVLFDEPSPAGVRRGVERFLAQRERFDPQVCRENALRFSQQRFREELLEQVEIARRDFADGVRTT
jgi:glycosyltransferase involved in cell wall biosynthesis